MKKLNAIENKNPFEPILEKLDIIIKLLMLNHYADEKNNLKLGETAKFLYSNGWEAKEIAKFLGKSKATEISYILYSKKNKKNINPKKMETKNG